MSKALRLRVNLTPRQFALLCFHSQLFQYKKERVNERLALFCE